MSTKLKTVSFDVELAKKISAGKLSGKITTRDGQDVQIIIFDRIGEYPIVALVGKEQTVRVYHANGNWDMKYWNNCAYLDLVLQIPEYNQFKNGDILVIDETILILDEYINESSATCYVILQDGIIDYAGVFSCKYFWQDARFATDEEKVKLYKAISDQSSK